MRCNPLVRRLQQLLGSGALGEVRQVRADLGFVVDKPPTDRLLDPALGGGALLDMGIYPLTFAHLDGPKASADARKSHPGRQRQLVQALPDIGPGTQHVFESGPPLARFDIARGLARRVRELPAGGEQFALVGRSEQDSDLIRVPREQRGVAA